MNKKNLSVIKINQQETVDFCPLVSFLSFKRTKSKNYYSTKITESSETARRITFQFNHFSTCKPRHTATVDAAFLSWFIGFVEGDGSFIICQNKVYFDLTQDLRDIGLLYQIKAALGFGKILTRTDKHRNVGVFYVTKKENFIRLAHLFNGNLVTNYKKKQFQMWLEVLNKQYKTSIKNIKSDIPPSFNDGWLSGFIDAEGCFITRVKNCHTSKLGKNVFIDFSITQKQKDILILIRSLFNIESSQNIRFDPSWQGYEFYLSNKKKLVPLINYLNKYALKTKKQADFFSWSKIHKLAMKKST